VEGREAGGRAGSGRKGAGTKTGKGVPTDSTPRKKLPSIKLAGGRREGWTRDNGRGLPEGDSRKELPLCEGTPIAITKTCFPRVQHPPETRVGPPPSRHQRSMPYKETSIGTPRRLTMTQIP